LRGKAWFQTPAVPPYGALPIRVPYLGVPHYN
jgi:hypothetical protein